MKDFCVILMFDRKFLKKAHDTIHQIRKVGLYEGDIVCIISDDLEGHYHLPKGRNIIVKHFKEVDKSKITLAPEKHPTDEQRKKLVQKCFPMAFKSIHYHKFYCAHTYFRERYKKCLYLDTGMQIYKPMDKIINLDCGDKFLAHSDSYPKYRTRLYGHFDKIIFPRLFVKLSLEYDLDVDSFQATMFLFNTKIIKDDTFDELWRLANLYINSKTNDQAIWNLYFKDQWEQIQIKDEETYFYDFYPRNGLLENDYIMLKYPNK